MARAFLPVLVVLALFALVGRAQPLYRTASAPPQPGTAPLPATTQELVLFTADGPVRVRLTVTRGGKPAGDPWRTALDTLFAHCDRDGDGALAATERAVFQVNRNQYADFVVIEGGLVMSSRAAGVSFPERNGKVDRALFDEGFLHAGLGPVSFTPVAVRKDSQALTDILFKKLDADGDGKLSAAELKAARERLAPLDADEDEVIDANELLGRAANPYYQFIEVSDFDGALLGSARRQPAPPALPDVFAPPLGQPVRAKDLLARDADKDNALSPKELGCDAKAIAALDADGDGRLDSDELAAWLRQPPDLDLTFDLPGPTRGGSWLRPATTLTPATVRLAPKSRLADKATPDGESAVRAVLPSARVRFAAEGGADAQWRTSVDGLRATFAMLAGTKGEVERKQVADNPEYAAAVTLFDFADRNGDGKVTTAELDRTIGVNGGLVNCRAALEVADLGRGLFELLDRDGDGRLSPRELNAAADQIAVLDRDGDGKLAPAEIPRGYAVTVKPASVDVIPTGGLALDTFVYSGTTRVTRTTSAGRVPEWFRQADRNGDGDVSAREFPGPPALFKKIDTDGDGLISPEEALAFDQRATKPR